MNYLNGDHREKMLNDILEGMTKRQKSIPAKYFCDARGSQLFDQICLTPEYYPTKTELSILNQSAAEICQFFFEEGGDLIELGSGSNEKIRKLLDGMPHPGRGRIRCVPVDISRTYPGLSVEIKKGETIHTEIGIKFSREEGPTTLPGGRIVCLQVGYRSQRLVLSR